MLDAIVPHLPRIISGLAGFSFLYMALFMYEDQAGRIQNRLVDLWVRVSAGHERFLGKKAAIIKTSSDIAELGFKWLFGEKLLSVQFVVVSFCMSVASLGTMVVCDDLASGSGGSPDYLITGVTQTALLSWSALHFLYGLFAARLLFRKDRVLLATLLFVVLFVVSSGGVCWAAAQHADWNASAEVERFVAITLSALIFGLVCDIVLLTSSRFLFRLVSKTTANIVLLLGLSFSAVWLCILLDCWRVFVFDVSASRDPLAQALSVLSAYAEFSDIAKISSTILYLGACSNLFNALAAGSLLIVVPRIRVRFQAA
jgi:hypothetical protein